MSTRNCRVKKSIGKSARDAKNTDFISILNNKLLTRFNKQKFKVRDRVRISKKYVPFRKGFKPQFSDKYLKFWQFYKKPPTYINKDLDQEEIPGKFYENELIK